jgi:tartrate-resistant acid phosphatase type 5
VTAMRKHRGRNETWRFACGTYLVHPAPPCTAATILAHTPAIALALRAYNRATLVFPAPIMSRAFSLRAAASALLTASVAADTLRVLGVGDWGGQNTPPYYTTVQTQVAAAMGQAAEAAGGVRAAHMYGDNFYSNGLSCLQDPAPNCTEGVASHRWNDTFEGIYTAPALQGIPFWALAGNHDWTVGANMTAELFYSNVSSRWRFPYFWYTFTDSFLPDGSSTPVTVQWIFIDTVLLCGQPVPSPSRAQREAAAARGEQLPRLDGQPHLPADGRLRPGAPSAEDQWTWINATIAASTADWTVVAGHYPVWSIAEHGSTECLVEQLRPMLQAYDIPLYFNGHDHK